MKVLCITLLVLLVTIQPGYANWWEDKQLWPTHKFEPWQSYIVRQTEWNKDGIYGETKSFSAKQREYGELCHQGAREAVRLFGPKAKAEARADFYKVLSFLGYVRSAIALRMRASEQDFSKRMLWNEPFGVERCVVSHAVSNAGSIFNPRESAFFIGDEANKLDKRRGGCKREDFFTPLVGQYRQSAMRLSQSRYKHPTDSFASYRCSPPTLRNMDPMKPQQYLISTPSQHEVYTQIVVLNHDIIKDEGNKDSCFGLIYHSGDAVVQKLLPQMSDLYTAILNSKQLDRNQITKQIATFQWMFAHAMPYARGSAAVGTIFRNAFYMYHNMEDAITPTREGVVVDIEALSTPLADFLDAYPLFYERARAK